MIFGHSALTSKWLDNDSHFIFNNITTSFFSFNKLLYFAFVIGWHWRIVSLLKKNNRTFANAKYIREKNAVI